MGSGTVVSFLDAVYSISIHASAWGCPMGIYSKTLVLRFQSTPPHEEQHERNMLSPAKLEFQSTPRRVGRKRNKRHQRYQRRISIHAPYGEAAFYRMQGFRQQSYFNPRPRAGSGTGSLTIPTSSQNFNPHTHRGATLSFHRISVSVKISIHFPSGERPTGENSTETLK